MSVLPSSQPASCAAAMPPYRGGRLRRLVLPVLCGVLVVAAVNGLLYWWRTHSQVEVPSIPAESNVELDAVVAMRIEEGRQAVRENPSSPETWGRLGMLFFVHFYYDEATVCFAHAERLEPDEPRWTYFQAVILEASDATAAMVKFERTLEKCGDRPPSVRLRYAELLLKENHPAEAEQQFQKILYRDGTDARAHLGMARLAAQRGDVEECLRHLERSVEDPAGQRDSHALMAEMYERRGEKKLAEEHHRAADQSKRTTWHDPFISEALEFRTGLRFYTERSTKLIKMGQLAEAEDLLDKMTRVYPKAPNVWTKLGKARLGRQNWSGADLALRRSLELEPEGVEAQYLMGLLREQQEDPKEASKWFSSATKHMPFHADGHYHLGLAYVQLHDRPGAVEAFRTALRCQPNMADAHVALATELGQDSRFLEALIHAQAAVQFKPNDGGAKKVLVQVLPRATFPIGP